MNAYSRPVTMSPEGELQIDGAALARLKRVNAEDAAAAPAVTIRLTEAELAEAGGSAILIESTVRACVKPGSPDAEAVAAEIVSTLRDIRPANGREAMLAAQMVVTHWAAMDSFRRAQTAQHPMMSSIHLGHAARLAHTHAKLSEALDKARWREGHRVVIVEHRYFPGSQG